MSVPSYPGQAPARRRPPGFLISLGWEAVLLVLVVIAVGVVATMGHGLDALGRSGTFYNFAAFGLLASAFALSLRTATPNLAVAGVAGTAGVVFAQLLDQDLPVFAAGLVAVLAGLLFGLIAAVVVGLTSAPSWAVTLGGLVLLQAVGAATQGQQGVMRVPGMGPPTTGFATAWTVLLLVVSIGGGVLCLVPAVGAFLGAGRAPADPVRFSGRRLGAALAGLGGSSLLAALSGVIFASYVQAVSVNFDGTGRLVLAVGAALLGGVSVFGGRGGIAGTVLAALLLTVIQLGMNLEAAPSWVSYSLLGGLAVIAGVLVSRTLEAVCGPPSLPEDPPAPMGARLPTAPQPVAAGGTALP